MRKEGDRDGCPGHEQAVHHVPQRLHSSPSPATRRAPSHQSPPEWQEAPPTEGTCTCKLIQLGLTKTPSTGRFHPTRNPSIRWFHPNKNLSTAGPAPETLVLPRFILPKTLVLAGSILPETLVLADFILPETLVLAGFILPETLVLAN